MERVACNRARVWRRLRLYRFARGRYNVLCMSVLKGFYLGGRQGEVLLSESFTVFVWYSGKRENALLIRRILNSGIL